MSWAGRGMAGTSWWVPAARWWSLLPRGPKRAVTSFRGRAARSAKVRRPSREKLSSRGRASRLRRLRGRQIRSASRGQGARNSGVRPGSTMIPWRAARTAPGRESAIPTWHSTSTSWVTVSTSAEARGSSPPIQAAGPLTWDRASPGRATMGSARREVRASMTVSKARAWRSSWGGRTVSSGHRERAVRSRMPVVMPARRAGAEAARTPRAPTTATGSVAGSGRRGAPWSARGCRCCWRASMVRATTGQSGTQMATNLEAGGPDGEDGCGGFIRPPPAGGRSGRRCRRRCGSLCAALRRTVRA